MSLHLADDQHLHDGWCQCRCNDCYSRLLGICLCLDCRCEPGEDEHLDEHNWLAEHPGLVREAPKE